jgi:hypothetical protein
MAESASLSRRAEIGRRFTTLENQLWLDDVSQSIIEKSDRLRQDADLLCVVVNSGSGVSWLS